MKIGLEVSSLIYPISGIQIHIKNLLKALPTVGPENEYHKIGTLVTYLYSRIPDLSPFWFKKFDILHGFDGFLPRTCFSRLKSVTIHDVLFLKNETFYSPEARRGLLRKLKWVLERTDIVIVPSEATRNDLAMIFPKEKIYNVSSGYSSVFRPLNTEEISLFKKKKRLEAYILFVGIIQERKNIRGLIESFFILKTKFPGMKLVLVSNHLGFGGEKILTAIENSKNDIILITNADEEEIVRFYNGASVFVFPSFGEGFGFPVLEAMACGTPVVTSHLSSLPEVGGDAVTYCNPCDPQDTANKMSSLLENENLRKEMREKGLNRAKQFSWEKTAEKLLNVWKENI